MFSKLKGDDGAEEDGGCHSSDSVNPSAGQISCLLKCGFFGLSPRSLDPGPLGSKGESR